MDGENKPTEENSSPPQATAPAQIPQVVPSPPANAPKSKKWLKLVGLIAAVAVIAAATWLLVAHFNHKTPAKSNSISSVSTNSTSHSVQGLQLDPNKDYGDKYADGILPVGDGKYQTSGAKVGYIYACTNYSHSLSSQQGGAMTRGPWFTDNNTEYNINQKLHVEGSVMWQAQFTNTVSGNTRTIVTNDLPSQPTGIFPIQTTDPAYQYDHNPNSIKGQTYTYSLSADPTYGSPQCMSGQSGIMLTGVALFNGLDAGGRDAGAWEVQDSCEGHPQSSGEYHYHTLSSCIKDISVKTVLGYALDGFPITGPEVGPNNFLTTSDLDVCHGITSQINLDGKSVTMYHYVMTQDYPYSVSCFRATPITPPGQGQGSNTGNTNPGGPNRPANAP